MTKPFPCVNSTHFTALLEDLAKRKVTKAKELLELIPPVNEAQAAHLEGEDVEEEVLETNSAAPTSKYIDQLSQGFIELAMKESNYNFLQQLYRDVVEQQQPKEQPAAQRAWIELLAFYHRYCGFYPKLHVRLNGTRDCTWQGQLRNTLAAH
jgi:hypothetical protein